MKDFPKFEIILEEFKSFLLDKSLPTDICWIFKDEYYRITLDKLYLHLRTPVNRNELMKSIYNQGRESNMVRIEALGKTETTTLATIWYPKAEHDRVQGIEYGLWLAVRDPCLKAININTVYWTLLKLFSSKYKQFHLREIDGMVFFLNEVT